MEPKNINKAIFQLGFGDIVTTRRTHRVLEQRAGLAVLQDVQNESLSELVAGMDHGSLRIDMVKKAAKPKPKDGEFVTAEQLRETMWKAGTTIRYKTVSYNPGRTVIAVLHKDGEWHAIDSNGTSWKWSFTAPPTKTLQYELLHVA